MLNRELGLHTSTVSDLSLEVSAMNFYSEQDILLSLSKLDKDKLLPLREQAEVHQVFLPAPQHKDLTVNE